MELHTEEEVERFLVTDTDKFWPGDYDTPFFKKHNAVVPRIDDHYTSLRYKTRVVCFLFDKQEYGSEYKELRDDAKFLATRDNLRIGVVDNQRVIKKIKAKYGVKMFSKISMSSLVLRRYDGELIYYDLTSEDHVYAHHWINKKSMKEVDVLENENYRIYELMRQPMFLVFVDFDDNRYSKKSAQAMEVIKEIAPKYSHVLGFLQVNNTQYAGRKRILGITWDELPAMAFNMFD